MKGLIVFGMGAIALIYLLNPGAGFIEIIPDNFPIVGNLDEAAAVALLLNCFRYFGIDLTNIFKKRPDKNNVIEV